MKAVIMAGGKGTRLRPLTCSIPKPMVPLLDRPVMEYAIELLKRHDILDIAVTVQHLPEVIRQYFGDGSDFGVRLHYFEEASPLGTAGSVKNAEEFLDETFLVISGDALTDYDLGSAVDFHRKKGSMATLVLASEDVPLEFGVVMTDLEGRITRFLEKPAWGEVFSDTVNTGIYVLEPDIFQYFDRGVEFDFSKDLFPLLLMMGRPMYGYKAEGYWSDIGSLSQYRQTQFDILDGKVNVAIRGTELIPQVWVGEGVKMLNGISFTAPAYIGDYAVLEDQVQIGAYSIVGAGCMLEKQAVLEKAVLWNHTVVEPQAEIKGATLGRHAIVRSGALIQDGAVIGDASQIGVKSFVQPGMKVWPGKIVDNYTRLSQSLIWGGQSRKALFGEWGVGGDCQGEITTTFAGRLALAFGSLLPLGRTVAIGHDMTPYARLIANALAGGLHASGLHTHDFGTVTSAITRYGVHHGEYEAGLHVRRAGERGEEHYLIEFLDRTGLPVSRSIARKVEQAFNQEDCRPIRPHQAGDGTAAPDIRRLYREHLLRMVDVRLVIDSGFTIMLHTDYRYHHGVIPELLEEMGCRVIQVNNPGAGREELTRMVKFAQADLGISLDDNGGLVHVVAEDGTEVEEELLGVLQLLIRLQEGEGALYVPVGDPGIVEGIGESYSREVIRTKTDIRSMMEGCQREGFHIRFDGVCMLVRLLEFMALEGRSLSDILKRVPRFSLSKRRVSCPWQDKGKVMRFLMEETKGEQVELIDGIKVYQDGGWTLILPDSDEPVFRVVANALSPQKADELANAYARKIEDYRGKLTASL